MYQAQKERPTSSKSPLTWAKNLEETSVSYIPIGLEKQKQQERHHLVMLFLKLVQLDQASSPTCPSSGAELFRSEKPIFWFNVFTLQGESGSTQMNVYDIKEACL